MTIFKHKRTGKTISMDSLTRLVKIYGLEGRIVINEPFTFKDTHLAEIKPSYYRLIEIPFSPDFEIDKSSELTEDDLIEAIYELKPSRIKDKIYRVLREMRNKDEI